MLRKLIINLLICAFLVSVSGCGKTSKSETNEPIFTTDGKVIITVERYEELLDIEDWYKLQTE